MSPPRALPRSAYIPLCVPERARRLEQIARRVPVRPRGRHLLLRQVLPLAQAAHRAPLGSSRRHHLAQACAPTAALLLFPEPTYEFQEPFCTHLCHLTTL